MDRMQSYPKEAPPPYGMAIPPPPMPQVQVIHTSFGPEPQPLVCPHCQSQVTTRVNVQPTTKTHLAALIICLLCFPCFFVPYCCDSCQSTNHYCPRCNVFLGTYDN